MDSYPEFKRRVDLALVDGRTQMEEIAEAVITNAIKKGDQGAAKYYLGHNSMRYTPKQLVDFIPPEQREQWEKKKQESVPTYHISEETAAKIMDALKRFGLLDDEGEFSDELIKKNPELFLQWIREDEAKRREEKRKKFFK
jgi:hypothetical protein